MFIVSLGNYHDAEEITFDTFVRCFKSLQSFDRTKTFSTWLYTIAHNLSIDFLRKHKIEYDYLDERYSDIASSQDLTKEYENKQKIVSLSSTCIQRPILTIVISIAIVVFGVIGFTFLGVREYPSVDPAVITVSTSYPGTNADVIDSQNTQRLEEAISGVAGIRTLNWVSRDGQGDITIEFNLGIDLETAANDVRDKVAGAIRLLPPDADPPVVAKADADAFPIIVMSVSSATRNLMELSEIADKVLKERLQTIDGVSQIRIFGEKRYSMRLWMDPRRLAAYGVTPLDVRPHASL